MEAPSEAENEETSPPDVSLFDFNVWQEETWGSCPDLSSTIEISEYFANEVAAEAFMPMHTPFRSLALPFQPTPAVPPIVELPQPVGGRHCPVTTAYEGDYGFYVDCPQQQRSTKGAGYTYDESLKKLFVKLDMACPFRVHLKREPPIGTTVRVMAVFSQPNDAMKPVKRCIRHMDLTDATNQSHPFPSHIIRCESLHAAYKEDPSTGHLSVVMDYTSPEAGTTCSTIHLRFMCLNSCTGGDGMNRRPIKAVFTLEHGDVVLGRLSMDVKVCACPTRDRRNEDKARLKLDVPTGVPDLSVEATTTSAPGDSTASANTAVCAQAESRKRGLTSILNIVAGPPTKTQRTSKESDGDEKSSYQLECPTWPIFCRLKVIRDALKLYDDFHESSGNQSSAALPSFPKVGGRAMLEFLQNRGSINSGSIIPSLPDLPGSQGNGNTCHASTSSNNPSRLDSATAVLASMKVEPGTSNSGPGHLTVESWLESLGLQHCQQALVENGYSDIGSFLEMSYQDILKVKMTPFDRRQLFQAIPLLHQQLFAPEQEEISSSPEFSTQESLRASQLSGSSSGSSTKSYRVTHVKIIRHLKDV
ncbi:tumor protein p73 isoform X1 [Ixodes scapularis]|uniref:tumor protein p73 isoform X1 n=1 Tax=Ixodes scapularis TaxID=6945 RepID=UPI001C385376|nr:tumor protein p73 isoform X1 [Ixodes scapularis]